MIVVTELYTKAKNRFEQYSSLPYPVYITLKTGVVDLRNSRFNEFFCIKDISRDVNIIHFYSVAEDREAILAEVEQAHDWIENRPITFQVNGKRRYARFSSKLFESKDMDEWYLLCIVVSTTGMGKYQVYEDDLSVGLFEISKQNQITHANKTFLQILGINQDDIHKVDLVKFLSVKKTVPNEDIYEKRKLLYADLLRELRDKYAITNREIAIQREDGTNIIVDLSLIIEEEHNGKIHKVKGLVKDITFDSVFEDIQNLDIGIFLLDRNNNQFVVRHCNTYFKEIFSINPDTNCIGWDFNEFFSPEVDYNQIYTRLVETDHYPIDFQVKNFVRTVNSVELSIRVKRILRGNTNSYVGAIYTDSDEVDIALKNLRNDFSSFLHSFGGTVGNIKDTLSAVISAHGTNAVTEGQLNRDIAYTYTKHYIAKFNDSLQMLYKEIETKNLDHTNNSEFIRHLDNVIEKVRDDKIVDKASAASIRSSFLRIQKLLKEYKDLDLVSRETEKQLRNNITQVFRFTRLISLGYLEQEAFEMSLEMEAFKDIIASQAMIPEKMNFNIHAPMQKAANFLQEYAERMDIDIKFHYSKRKSYNVYGDERNLFTVFYNLLHNAVKYSFTKPRGARSTVDIFLENDIQGQNYVITIENRGVGIPQEEIDNRTIFKFGSRGKGSEDRKLRKGHGIGLWHCEKIVNQFRGNISATSEKIGYGILTEGTPHITRFLVVLPSARS